LTSWILFKYRNSGHDTKLNALTTNIAALFDVGLAVFYGQQTFRAILVTNGAPAALFGIDQYFGNMDFFHGINFKLWVLPWPLMPSIRLRPSLFPAAQLWPRLRMPVDRPGS